MSEKEYSTLRCICGCAKFYIIFDKEETASTICTSCGEVIPAEKILSGELISTTAQESEYGILRIGLQNKKAEFREKEKQNREKLIQEWKTKISKNKKEAKK